MKRVVCIPAYNEGHIIHKVITECKKYADLVIVCDDGSSDNTSVEAKSAGALIINHNTNKGKGAALRSLFDAAQKNGADVTVTIDGDGQFLPEEIPKLMNPILEKQIDIVIGYRFSDSTSMPSYRQFGNKILDKITNLASELPFRDTQSGFRAYSKKALTKIQFSNDNFAADSEILINASNMGLKISEEKITVLYDLDGSTSTLNPVHHSASVFSSLVEIIALKRPLLLLGIPGLILTIIGIIYSVNVVSLFNETRYFSIPITLLSIGALTTGLILSLMSIVLFSISKVSKKV